MNSQQLGRQNEGIDFEIDAAGCWVWIRGRSRKYPSGYAHRKYWEAVNGPKPAGWHIHHTCKNTFCVNPDHLEAIDPDQHRVIHFLEERTGLTVEQLKEMRRRMRDVNQSIDALGEEFGVSSETAHVIKRGERWVSVIGESGPVVVDNPRSCLGCGATVEGRKRHALYCSRRCRQASNDRKYRARRATASTGKEQRDG